MKKEIYKPPRVELFYLGEKLNILKNFSSQGGLEDWAGGSADGAFDDGIEPGDWFGGGTSTADNGSLGGGC